MQNTTNGNQSEKCKFSPSMKAQLQVRDNCQCVFCGSMENLTIAHFFVPRYLGGRPIPQNGLTLCRDCHDVLDFPTEMTMALHDKIKSFGTYYMVILYGEPDLDLIMNKKIHDKRLAKELRKQKRYEQRHPNLTDR